MAIGDPLLATWDGDGVVQTYEFVGDTFVSLSSLGGFSHTVSAPPADVIDSPSLFWDRGGEQIIIVTALNSSAYKVTRSPPILDNSDTGFLQHGTTGFTTGYEIAFDRQDHTLIGKQREAFANTAFTRNPPTAPLSQNANQALVNASVAGIGVSPNGLYLVVGTRTGQSVLYTRDNASGQFDPKYNVVPSQLIVGFAGPANIVVWGANSRFFALGNRTTGLFHIYEIVDGVAESRTTIAATSGDKLQRAVFSPDNRHLMISYLRTGAFLTKIFRRVGYFFQLEQTIATGHGYLLDISADGRLLVDATSRTCYAYDGDTFNLVTGAMSNVPIGVLAQGLSDNLPGVNNPSTLYRFGTYLIASQQVTLNALKITLLRDTAVFDRDHTTLAEVTVSGNNEVNTGGWPSGGVAINNVAMDILDGNYVITADDVHRVIVETNITDARYAVIYDDAATDNAPLMWIDLGGDRLIQKNTEFALHFTDGVVVTFSS